MACPTGKIQNPTREAALAQQKELVYHNYVHGQSERSKGLNVYPCPEVGCGAWHVGHTEGPRMPLVYHYTVGRYLDRILDADELRPPKPRRMPGLIDEPNPLLWFSWNAEWEHSVLKDPRPRRYRVPPTGRAITEVCGWGLIRFGAPATVAKLRWNDYLALNQTAVIHRDAMAQRGNPVDWLATDQAIPLSQCRTFEVWYGGQWVAGDSVDPEAFDAYLEARMDVYDTAWDRLIAKILAAEDWQKMSTLVMDDDAETILLDDYLVGYREWEWKRAHRTEIQQFNAKLPRRKGKGFRQ